MALVKLPSPLLISTFPASPVAGQMNALDESVAGIGVLHLEGGPGTKTISAGGGGAILWANSGTPVFANVGTTLRLGLQDPSLVNYMEDGTFDVYADLIGGSATIPTNGWLTTLMTTGSKTLSHGGLVATAWKMIARAGTDTVSAQRTYAFPWSGGLGYYWSASIWPHGAHNTGTGNSRQEEIPVALIRFDDGTYGWIEGTFPCMPATGATSAFSTTDAGSPDEYASVFAVPFRGILTAIVFLPNNLTSTINFAINILSDPWGTPAAIPGMPVSWLSQKVYQVNNGAVMVAKLPTPLTVEPGVQYAVSWYPTTSSSSNWSYYAMTSGYGAILKKALPLSVAKVAARTNYTGPFVETSVDHSPLLGLYFSHLETGAVISAPPNIGVSVFGGGFHAVR